MQILQAKSLQLIPLYLENKLLCLRMQWRKYSSKEGRKKKGISAWFDLFFPNIICYKFEDLLDRKKIPECLCRKPQGTNTEIVGSILFKNRHVPMK